MLGLLTEAGYLWYGTLGEDEGVCAWIVAGLVRLGLRMCAGWSRGNCPVALAEGVLDQWCRYAWTSGVIYRYVLMAAGYCDKLS